MIRTPIYNIFLINQDLTHNDFATLSLMGFEYCINFSKRRFSGSYEKHCKGFNIDFLDALSEEKDSIAPIFSLFTVRSLKRLIIFEDYDYKKVKLSDFSFYQYIDQNRSLVNFITHLDIQR